MSSEIETAATKSAAEIGRAIGAGRLDPVALTEFYLARAAEHPNIYVRLTPERALREARAAARRAKAGLRRGPLDGVPISWKDLVDLAGTPTEAGTRLRAGYTPQRDAPVAERAARAGLAALGKTHLSELAFSGLGYNPMIATAPNRFDPERVPGGSSSGAAASLTYGLAAAAVGSDTGGSVRIPSAWNGLVGLKTTAGLIPLDGVTPLSPTLDTIGPLTRSVEDAALLHAVLADAAAPDLAGAMARGLSLYLPETVVLDQMDAGLRDAFEAALERLARAGATVHRGPAPEFAEALTLIRENGGIVDTEGYAIWREAIEARPDAMFAMVRERFRGGARFRADQIEHVHLTLKTLKRRWLTRVAGHDAAIMPTTPNLAPKLAAIIHDPEAYVRENLLALRNTRLGNLLGLCALALPTGATAIGHPASLMLFAPPFAEARLLRVGAALERALA